MSQLILLISDDRSTEHRLRHALTKVAPECEVEVVGSRQEINAFRRPAVILLDLMLAGEPASDVLRWLRTEQQYERIPIFVLGSEVVDHEVNEAFALGANSCLLMRAAPEGFDPIAHGIATYASLIPAQTA